jgi:hypothetical protein
MWFNSRRSERPHHGLTFYRLSFQKWREIRKDDKKAAAWLSSARTVRCSLKWGNERNPYRLLNFQTRRSRRLSGRKVGTTSSQHGAYAVGHTHPTMTKNSELQAGNGKQISEISPQLGLESATRLHELGIGSNRGSAGRGEYVLGSCTHRPSSQQSWGWPMSSLAGWSQTQRWGLSRNKVSLLEGGDGSPPFFFLKPLIKAVNLPDFCTKEDSRLLYVCYSSYHLLIVNQKMKGK